MNSSKKPEPIEPNAIGNRIRRRMADRQMNAASLARAIGIKPPSLSDILSGQTKQPAASTLTQLAEALWTTERWIVHGQGPADRMPPSAPDWVTRLAKEIATLPEERAKNAIMGVINGIREDLAAEAQRDRKQSRTRDTEKAR